MMDTSYDYCTDESYYTVRGNLVNAQVVFNPTARWQNAPANYNWKIWFADNTLPKPKYGGGWLQVGHASHVVFGGYSAQFGVYYSGSSGTLLQYMRVPQHQYRNGFTMDLWPIKDGNWTWLTEANKNELIGSFYFEYGPITFSLEYFI
jgi:hypothetical protein